MEWNKQQKEAIESRGYDLLVTAAAGSGKTAIMVERLCQMILRKEASIRDMAVVTFTRAAAAEMRARMEARLTMHAETDEALRPYLYDQLTEFPSAAIGTLHSFCGSLIRRFYHVAQVDPSFSSGDDGYAAILREQSLEETLEDFFERKPKHYADFARSWGGKTTDGLKPLIMSVYDMALNQPEGIQWLTESTRMLSVTRQTFEGSLWREEFVHSAQQRLGKATLLLDNLIQFCQERNAGAKTMARLSLDHEMTAALQGYFDASRYDQANELLNTNRIFGILQIDKSMKEEEKEIIKDRRQKWKDELKSLLENPLLADLELLLENTNHMQAHMELLCDIVKDFDSRYANAKRIHNLLDFSDLEHFALKVLQDENAAGQIRSIYPYVFVDEYQDISPVQNAILDGLRTEGCFFCVGDIKQSIYRFRSAAPEIFLQSVQDCAKTGRKNIALSFNYRSSGSVISIVNHVFSTLMSPELGDVEYVGDALLETLDAKPREYPAVEVLLVDNQDEKQGELSEIEDLVQTQREAILAGQKILEIIDTPIWDGKAGSYRPLVLGDIAVLIRQNMEARSIYADVFRRMGIPAVANSELGFAQEMEVALLMDVLRLCNNFRLDHELIHVMYSMLGGFTAAELMDIREEYPNCSYVQAVRQYPEDHEDELGHKITGFLDQIHRWRVVSMHTSVEELLYRICGDTGFYDAVGVLPQGYRRQLSIRTLGKLSASFGMGALQDFIDASEQLIGGINVKISVVEAENAINIMTVHSSKGLEFPVVFLCNTNSSFSRRDSSEALLMHRQLGLGPLFYESAKKIKGDTLAHKAIALRNRREFLSEEMRLLYVALTRAKERLIISGTSPDLISQAQKWSLPAQPALLSDCTSLLDWVGFGLLDVRDDKILCNLPGVRLNIAAARDIRLPKQITNDRKVNIENLRQAIEQTPPDTDIQRQLSWVYPYTAALGLPAKISVTSLLEKRDWRTPAPPPPENAMPRFMQSKSSFQAVELGSFVHTILQHVPFAIQANELRDFALSLQGRGLLPDGAVDAINLSWVQRFLDSTIAGRIRNSTEVQREMPFNIALPAKELFPEEESDEPIMVQGIIDCCFLEEGHWVLLDYKTNAVRQSSDVQNLADYYTPQLRIYAIVLQKLTGIPVGECCLFLVSIGREVFLNI